MIFCSLTIKYTVFWVQILCGWKAKRHNGQRHDDSALHSRSDKCSH